MPFAWYSLIISRVYFWVSWCLFFAILWSTIRNWKHSFRLNLNPDYFSWGALEKRTNKHQSDESSYNRLFCIVIWAQYYWAVNAEKWQNHWRIKSTHRNENAIYGFVFSYFLTIFFCCFCISSVCCVNSIQIQTHWDIFWMKMGKRMEKDKESKKSTGNTYE